MIDAEAFLTALDGHGCGPYLGVPCSYLTPLFNATIASPRHTFRAASNEGEAVAMAVGAHLAGRRPVVMFQNSGLGNTVNPLTSLVHTFQVPLLLVTTQRGEPGRPDEPQHALMGAITEDLLRVLRVPCALFPDTPARIAPRVAEAMGHLEAGRPFAFVLRQGGVAEHALPPQSPPPFRPGEVLPGAAPDDPPALERAAAIAAVAQAAPAHAALIATTGKIGRELFACAEGPRNLYVVGSMGCAASIALGVALEQPERPVLALDGDGAALMRLEALAGIGHYRPPRLVHMVLDNRVHESTGGQPSLAGTVDFPRIAAACGYATAVSVTGAEALREALAAALATPGPHLVHVRVHPGSAPGLGRPTLTPVQVKQRFMGFLAAALPHAGH